MDPLSVAGSVFSGVTLAIQVVRGASVFFVILSPSFREKQKLVKDHGWLTACFLLLGSGKAFAVMRRVERYVLNTGKSDVLFFKESFSSSTNMIAVAVRLNCLPLPPPFSDVHLISFCRQPSLLKSALLHSPCPC